MPLQELTIFDGSGVKIENDPLPVPLIHQICFKT